MKNYAMELSVSTDISNSIIEVDKQSEIKLFEEVYKLAKYFKEELNYDSIPFCPYGDLREEYKVLLFTEEADRWVLRWMWLHPFFRNRGNLKRNWHQLEERFGNFIIETPISNDMRCFLKNINSKYEHIEI